MLLITNIPFVITYAHAHIRRFNAYEIRIVTLKAILRLIKPRMSSI